MIVVPLLHRAELGPNDYWEDIRHFKTQIRVGVYKLVRIFNLKTLVIVG